MKNQNVAAAINDSLLNLTEKTVSDSTTVKWITLLSLIYLPGSFVGVGVEGWQYSTFSNAEADSIWNESLPIRSKYKEAYNCR